MSKLYSPENKKRALVTGGAGFVGSHLAQSLLANGYAVTVFDDFSTGLLKNLQRFSQEIEIIQGSILDETTLSKAVAEVEIVFHLAAIASVQKSLENPHETHAVCATGTLNVLKAAKNAGCKRVVYAGSSSAYGNCELPQQSEESPLMPLSPYAAGKLSGEFYCQCFAQAMGLETVRLRFFNIYGPRQRADSPYSGVIALFSRAFQQQEPPKIFGDGLQTRDFVHVDDVVLALTLAGSTEGISGEVFNIGTGQGISLLNLIETLGKVTGKQITPEFLPGRAGEVRHSRAVITKAIQRLGYKPAISFEKGISTLFSN